MLESLKLPSLQPSGIPATIPEESSGPNGLRNSSENLPNDPFLSTVGNNRDRSDLSFNNHPSFFNRLNEFGNGTELETPTTQPTGSASHEMFGPSNGLNLVEKPMPVRKTRAVTSEITSRKLTSRSARDIGNDGKRQTASQDSGPQAPARRSTRLTSKFTSKLGVGSERETRLGAKEREREAKKVKAVGRGRSLHLGGNSAAAREREKEREKANSEDVNVSSAKYDETYLEGPLLTVMGEPDVRRYFTETYVPCWASD
jgi:anaphase-promoting complex subunit 3